MSEEEEEEGEEEEGVLCTLRVVAKAGAIRALECRVSG